MFRSIARSSARIAVLGALVAAGAGALTMGSTGSALAAVQDLPTSTAASYTDPATAMVSDETRSHGVYLRTFHAGGVTVAKSSDNPDPEYVQVEYWLETRAADGSWNTAPGNHFMDGASTWVQPGQTFELGGGNVSLPYSVTDRDAAYRIQTWVTWYQNGQGIANASLTPGQGQISCANTALTCAVGDGFVETGTGVKYAADAVTPVQADSMMVSGETSFSGRDFRTFGTSGATVAMPFFAGSSQKVTASYELQTQNAAGTWVTVPGVAPVDLDTVTLSGKDQRVDLDPAVFTLPAKDTDDSATYRVVYHVSWYAEDDTETKGAPVYAVTLTSQDVPGSASCQNVELTCQAQDGTITT